MRAPWEQARWDRGRTLAVLRNNGADDLREMLGMYEPLPEPTKPASGSGRLYSHNAGRVRGKAI